MSDSGSSVDAFPLSAYKVVARITSPSYPLRVQTQGIQCRGMYENPEIHFYRGLKESVRRLKRHLHNHLTRIARRERKRRLEAEARAAPESKKARKIIL